MGLDKVTERKLLVFLAQHRTGDEAEHHVLGGAHIALARHAADGCGRALSDLALKVHCPAVAAKRVATVEVGEPMGLVGAVAHTAIVVPRNGVQDVCTTAAAARGGLDAGGHQQTSSIDVVLRNDLGDVPLVLL